MEGLHKDISVAEFLSAAIHLSEVSGNIIREVYASGDIGTQQKDKNEGPVTVADLRVQKTIETCLKALFPTLVVQGEEEKANYAKYESVIAPELVDKTMIKQEFLNKMHMERKSFIEDYIMKVMPEDGIQQVENPFETFNTNNAVVWIDPLDGTSDFVAGNLPAVTVLIGLSINGSSRIGIVHNPFSIED
jgi:3'(2'), 5'-bisphosphate nucleotidase